MTKTAYYFPHDYNARTDPKLQAVMVRHGITGIGAYWCIVEQLYEQGGALDVDAIYAIAFALHADEALIESIVYDFDLFVIDDEKFYSLSANRRMEKRKKISDARRESANKRWKKTDNKNVANKNDDDDESAEESEKCNCIENECKCNAIKENKIKRNKKKVKEIKGDNNPPTPLNSPNGEGASAVAADTSGGGGGQASLSLMPASPGYYYYQQVEGRVDLHAKLSPYVDDYDSHRSEVDRLTCYGHPDNLATSELENWAKWQAYARSGGTMDVRIKPFDTTLSALRRHAENGGIPGVLTFAVWSELQYLDTLDMEPANRDFVRRTALATPANLVVYSQACRRAKGKRVTSPEGIIYEAMRKIFDN